MGANSSAQRSRCLGSRLESVARREVNEAVLLVVVVVVVAVIVMRPVIEEFIEDEPARAPGGARFP